MSVSTKVDTYQAHVASSVSTKVDTYQAHVASSMSTKVDTYQAAGSAGPCPADQGRQFRRGSSEIRRVASSSAAGRCMPPGAAR